MFPWFAYNSEFWLSFKVFIYFEFQKSWHFLKLCQNWIIATFSLVRPASHQIRTWCSLDSLWNGTFFKYKNCKMSCTFLSCEPSFGCALLYQGQSTGSHGGDTGIWMGTSVLQGRQGGQARLDQPPIRRRPPSWSLGSRFDGRAEPSRR